MSTENIVSHSMICTIICVDVTGPKQIWLSQKHSHKGGD